MPWNVTKHVAPREKMSALVRVPKQHKNRAVPVQVLNHANHNIAQTDRPTDRSRNPNVTQETLRQWDRIMKTTPARPRAPSHISHMRTCLHHCWHQNNTKRERDPRDPRHFATTMGSHHENDARTSTRLISHFPHVNMFASLLTPKQDQT
jgi:hypothetical protein